MNCLLPLLSEPWVQRLGWVLIHFLWQGTVIAILLGGFLRLASGLTSQARYLVIAASLALCGLSPIVTWSVLSPTTVAPVTASAPLGSPLPVPTSSGEEPTLASPMVPTRGLPPVPAARPSLFSSLSAATPYVVVAWFVGSLLFSLRLAYGWLSVLRIRRSGEVLEDPEIVAIFRRQMEMFSISGPVRLVQSVAVEVPTLIGWLRPVILLPVSVVTGLSRDHLEAILAHELAHVRRWDYAVNFLQSVVEVGLFYHPAVWWISGKLREEREHCCDDLAIRVLQDRFTYASALASLEECRAATLTLTASGSLLQRIRRIAGVREARASVWPLCLAVAIVIVGLTRFATAASPASTPEISASSQDLPLSQKQLNRNLLAASVRGDLPEVNRLLDLGAEPTVNDGTLYNNAFFAAAATNHPEIVRAFLAQGVDPNTKDLSKVRAIEWVLDQGNLPMATLLKDAGATMDPIRWAGATGDNATLESLLVTDPKPDRFNRAFRYAVSMGRLDTVKLIERLSGKPIPGSLLTQAATAGQIPMMEYILAQGADLQKDGEKAMDRTVSFFNQPEAVRLLLKRGVDPNRVTVWGNPLLSMAQNRETIKVLLEGGADPNVEGLDHPLSVAPDAESVRLLIQYGADPKRPLNGGVDLLAQANTPRRPDRPEVIEELIKQGVPFDPKGNGVKALNGPYSVIL